MRIRRRRSEEDEEEIRRFRNSIWIFIFEKNQENEKYALNVVKLTEILKIKKSATSED